VGALAGHALGEWLQPDQGGTSVAFAGVLGGLAAYALAGRRALPRPVRIEAALLIPAALVDTALGDIHGLPFLAGLALTAVWFRRDPADRTATTNVRDTLTMACSTAPFTDPAPAQSLERAAAALRAHWFTVEILPDAATARARITELIPAGASVFTGASETLRLSGIDEDLNASGRYQAVKPRIRAMDRATHAHEIRRLVATPDVVVGSVAAVTETGSLVAASASGSQLPAYAGGAARAIWVIGAQKVVPDLDTALHRVHEHALPLENARAQSVHGRPSAVNRLLVLNAEPAPGRTTVLLLREAIGF
jgi:L-lactate utilization protein LutC